MSQQSSCRWWLTCLVMVLYLSELRAQQQTPPLDLATFPRTTLEITHQSGGQARRFNFQVWIADTPQRAEQGLMFVSDLPETLGMVFPVAPPRVENMWMKNTYIELDMLFIDPHGRISKIIQRAAPLSLQTLSSDAAVSAVVELRGGQVAKLGVQTGDTVSWKKPAPQ
ncbi:MAG TPA: DUF192 domain-containing protein [Steroidobacteraceae bacterium]|nr:DUF192 domain-containing protein [Steroidobacteraceae bacterium]